MYDCDDASVSSNSDMLSLADGEISIKEVESAIRSLKRGKAAGADEVTAEMIKYGGPRVLDLFWFLCNLCWKSGEVPLYKGKGSQTAQAIGLSVDYLRE